MQNNYLTQKYHIKTNTIPTTDIKLFHDANSNISSINQDEFSQNQLNLGFIAEQSKMLLSDSQSVRSDRLSISSISVIRGNQRQIREVNSPFYFEQSMSAVSQWSLESISFAKHTLKRPNPSIDQQQNQEEMQNRCTKRKMNERMKVVTINGSKNNSTKNNNDGYVLRSRRKSAIPSQSSSNEDLREMLHDIENHGMGSSQGKNKTCRK